MRNKITNKWTKWHHVFHQSIINNENFMPNGISLLISVSGGQDSMALMTLLNDIKERHNWSLSVWHGNHKWHNHSEKFAEELQNYCSQKKIIFFKDSADKIDISTEEKARKWRYQKLYEKASEICANNKNHNGLYIVTGHTSTDNSETFLLNLARGSNFGGLSGIPNKRLLNKNYFLVRPLIIFSRNDTTAICKTLKIPVWEDPTNSDIQLKRNLIRHKVIHELEEIHPGCSYRINNFIEKMKNYSQERSELCELAIKSCLCTDGIRRTNLIDLGEQTRATLLHSLLSSKCKKQISSKNIDDLSKQISKKNFGQKYFSNGIKVIWNKNFIKITSSC
tara:strand:+ start:46 stop:1053 length:1008 start_codon:yes stop_codon:yes gene_type:complete